ncbi:hypothetical protein DV515_00008571, partial [Chloebia gouldiae]
MPTSPLSPDQPAVTGPRISLTREGSDWLDSLEEIPQQLCCWSSLSRVYVRNTMLHTAPASSTRLISIRTLDRSEKHFDDIPKGIFTMKN